MIIKTSSIRTFAGFSILAALSSPTFGLNIVFNSTATNQSTVRFFHDAEDTTVQEGTSPANFRETVIDGSKIPLGSSPGYQLVNGTVTQFGAPAIGNSQARMGVGHMEDTRTATMTVQSLSFVNQNEVNTQNANELMKGNSLLRTDFSMVWDVTGVYGPNLVGRMSIPLKATVEGTGSARVQLTNVRWEVDLANDGAVGYFDARPAYSGEVAFTSPGTFSSVLTSNSVVLKNQAGAVLTMNAGDKFRLSGALTFLADGNSPASIGYDDYQSSVLANNPLRYYRMEESATSLGADDIGSTNADGNYQGDIQLQQQSASFSLGNAAKFASSFESSSALVQTGSNELNLANSPFTIEAWVARGESLGTTGFRSIVDNQSTGGIGWRLGMNDNAILFDGNTDLIVPYTSTVGEFYHIVAVADGLGGGAIYVNGLLVGSGAYQLTTNGGGAFLIGASGNSTDQFIGTIDEVALYGQALAPSVFGRRYNLGSEDGDLLPVMGLQIDNSFVDSIEVPEPATASLALLGLAGLALRRRRTV